MQIQRIRLLMVRRRVLNMENKQHHLPVNMIRDINDRAMYFHTDSQVWHQQKARLSAVKDRMFQLMNIKLPGM